MENKEIKIGDKTVSIDEHYLWIERERNPSDIVTIRVKKSEITAFIEALQELQKNSQIAK